MSCERKDGSQVELSRQGPTGFQCPSDSCPYTSKDPQAIKRHVKKCQYEPVQAEQGPQAAQVEPLGTEIDCMFVHLLG